MERIVATAIQTYLTAQVQSSEPTRRFFRIDGFDNEIYQRLLDGLHARENSLAGQRLWVRTAAPISGYEEYALEQGKSATWYRNHVPLGHILVLIFNAHTSDAQSLKNIYPITESLLATKGLDTLIGAAFTNYQLSSEQVDVLKTFLDRLSRTLVQPQLRDIVTFLSAINTYLDQNSSASIKLAIAESLPFLGLFRCGGLVDVLNTSKSDRLLRDIFRAARLGAELLNESQLNAYVKQLEQTEFDDDSAYGGFSPQEKRNLLRRFLTNVLTDRNELLSVLRLEWQEVAPILHKKLRKTKSKKLQGLAETLQAALDEQHLEIEALPELVQDTVQSLVNGNEPETEGLDALLTEYGDSLPKPLRNQLRRLLGVRKYQSTDFIVGITYLAVELLTPLQGELPEGIALRVQFNNRQLEKVSDKEAEALLAFFTLYGGVENAMPSVQWNLASLWILAQQHSNQLTEAEETETDQEKVTKVDLLFRISVVNGEENEITYADLTWHYRSDGPAAATLAHIQAEAKDLTQESRSRLPIPLYNTCPAFNDLGDLDLSRPVFSMGAWYFEKTDLGKELRDALNHRTQPKTLSAIDTAITQLEESWTSFIDGVTKNGILAADLDSLLAAYEVLLGETTACLRSGQEATYGFRLLTQAWIIGPKAFEEWAVIPFLHPLKLQWWRERTRRFNTFLADLLNSSNETTIVDERRFRQEMSITYGSAGYPAVLALPLRDNRPEYFLPIHEVDGYELFQWMGQAGIAYGLNPDLVAEDESEQAAQVASRELARVVQDYVETHPFVCDGLEIYLVQCRNGSLPILLVEQLNSIAHRQNWGLHLDVIVHSTERGASLYERVTEWLKAHEELAARPTDAYFPSVTLKVLECSYEELFHQVDDTDIVILPDVLAEKGQTVESEYEDIQTETVPLTGYLPVYPVQQAPFERGEFTRDILLTSPPQPSLMRHFYNIQRAACERKPIPADKEARFQLQVSLQDWERELTALHERFNWVVCYDTTVDRFLLKDTLPNAVEVIRYSLGLGTNRRHNLTVSSSYRAQDIVVRRLTNNLEKLLPSTPSEFRQQVAQQLVQEAKKVSGNLVLRAAGPGAYLNELIGMVIAKHLTERRYLQEHPDALITWIYLDDFAHWFDNKLPDLLFVAVPPETDGKLLIHAEVLETKCVGETSFDLEATDAQQQVAQGINRLAQAWTPGATHLDAPYWYDQFYKAVVGNLIVSRDQIPLWEVFRREVPKGNFNLSLSGHAWIFCHDGSASIRGLLDEREAKITAPDVQSIPHLYHHFGRAGLRKALQELVEETWHIPTPANTWSSTFDAPPATASTAAPTVPPQLESSVAAEPRAKLPSSTTDIPSVTPETPSATSSDPFHSWLTEKSDELMRTLRNYDIQIYPIETEKADIGPSIVRFKVRLKPGEKLSRLQNINEDLARELALGSVPLIANVPGSYYVGIDLPRAESEIIYLSPLLDNLSRPSPGALPIIIGQTPEGQTVIEDLSEFPHLLVAGATNSGKSVFLRNLVLCLLVQYSPTSIRLLIVDPKRTDFSFFNGLPYLIDNKVIADQEEARDRLLDLVRSEMPRRQKIMAGRSLRVKDFNSRYPDEALPPIVAIIDEYAQLISIMAKRERESFERDLMSLAAVARSTGIHLILATQRPSADVVTGTLKANLPASIAFKVASSVNSRIVIDQNGAENLLGRGDMLFQKPSGEILRLQAPFMDEVTLQKYLQGLK
jgi:hypothetical protein